MGILVFSCILKSMGQIMHSTCIQSLDIQIQIPHFDVFCCNTMFNFFFGKFLELRDKGVGPIILFVSAKATGI